MGKPIRAIDVYLQRRGFEAFIWRAGYASQICRVSIVPITGLTPDRTREIKQIYSQ